MPVTKKDIRTSEEIAERAGGDVETMEAALKVVRITDETE